MSQSPKVVLPGKPALKENEEAIPDFSVPTLFKKLPVWGNGSASHPFVLEGILNQRVLQGKPYEHLLAAYKDALQPSPHLAYLQEICCEPFTTPSGAIAESDFHSPYCFSILSFLIQHRLQYWVNSKHSEAYRTARSYNVARMLPHLLCVTMDKKGYSIIDPHQTAQLLSIEYTEFIKTIKTLMQAGILQDCQWYAVPVNHNQIRQAKDGHFKHINTWKRYLAFNLTVPIMLTPEIKGYLDGMGKSSWWNRRTPPQGLETLEDQKYYIRVTKKKLSQKEEVKAWKNPITQKGHHKTLSPDQKPTRQRKNTKNCTGSTQASGMYSEVETQKSMKTGISALPSFDGLSSKSALASLNPQNQNPQSEDNEIVSCWEALFASDTVTSLVAKAVPFVQESLVQEEIEQEILPSPKGKRPKKSYYTRNQNGKWEADLAAAPTESVEPTSRKVVEISEKAAGKLRRDISAFLNGQDIGKGRYKAPGKVVYDSMTRKGFQMQYKPQIVSKYSETLNPIFMRYVLELVVDYRNMVRRACKGRDYGQLAISDFQARIHIEKVVKAKFEQEESKIVAEFKKIMLEKHGNRFLIDPAFSDYECPDRMGFLFLRDVEQFITLMHRAVLADPILHTFLENVRGYMDVQSKLQARRVFPMLNEYAPDPVS